MLGPVAWLLGACSSGDPPGFDTPESVVHDPVVDVWLVSNLRGAPLAKDGNGYIARVSPDGSMRRWWIEGGRNGVTLHAPKGMALAGDQLWVADIDVLRCFDRETGAPVTTVAIPGATFLNDVAAGPDGEVYVTDTGLAAQFAATGTDAIWRVGPLQRDDAGRPEGVLTPRVLARGVDLGQPNGIVARTGGVYVVSWRDGTFFQIDYRGVRTDLGKAPAAQLDGLVRVERADQPPAWYTTSWAGKCVYRFDLTGGVQPLPRTFEQPADLGFDAVRGQLLVPLFGANRVERVPL
jgi:hypothetical protein